MKVVRLLPALALTVACTDQPLAPVASPSFEIRDAAHEGSAGFYWLPPLVPNPSFAGTFDASCSPVVTITDRDTDELIASFDMTTGPGSETVRVADPEHYIVNWHTGDFDLDPSDTYRISVSADQTELGIADVDIVAGGNELKNVNSGEYIGLLDGRTLPIKFRIEEEGCGGATSF